MFDQSLNTTHISTNLRDYEAARSSFFVFVVAPQELTNLLHPDFDPDSGTATEDDKTLYNGQVASDAIRLNVVKSSVPNFTVSKDEYRRGNDVVHFAGLPTFADGSITVDDVVGLDTKSILYSWLYLAYNPHTRKGGRMKDYKKTCTLIEYTQDYTQIRHWTLEGCFITGIEESEFNKEEDSGTKRQLTVSISYDRAIMSLDETAAQ
jgi:hypothetical protein